jgi:negative regulator of flagellin synthesis FlgM
MKITHNKIGQNLNLTDSASKADKSKSSSALDGLTNDVKTKSADQIKDLSGKNENEAVKMELSSRAQDIRQVKELAMGAPDIDHAKVEKFRKLIDEGKYKVDAKAVADRMVEDSFMMAGSGATGNE